MPCFPTNSTVNVYRLTRTGNAESYGAAIYTGLPCLITPAGTDLQTTYGGMQGYQIYEMFIYDITKVIKNGDKITAGSINYLVAGVPYLANNKYLKYIRLAVRLLE